MINPSLFSKSVLFFRSVLCAHFLPINIMNVLSWNSVQNRISMLFIMNVLIGIGHIIVTRVRHRDIRTLDSTFVLPWCWPILPMAHKDIWNIRRYDSVRGLGGVLWCWSCYAPRRSEVTNPIKLWFSLLYRALVNETNYMYIHLALISVDVMNLNTCIMKLIKSRNNFYRFTVSNCNLQLIAYIGEAASLLAKLCC